jgi:hypothetical protein
MAFLKIIYNTYLIVPGNAFVEVEVKALCDP